VFTIFGANKKTIKQKYIKMSATKLNPQIDKTLGVKEVALLNRYGYRVPDELIVYNDDDIDFSDDADITDDDLQCGKIKWSYKAEIQLKPEVKLWIQQEKINLNELIGNLVENF